MSRAPLWRLPEEALYFDETEAAWKVMAARGLGESRAIFIPLVQQDGNWKVAIDDQVRLPFTRVLSGEWTTLLRRGGPSRSDQLVCGSLVVNRLSRQALVSGTRLTLTTKEFAMLEFFVTHADEAVTRTQLLERVWERNRDPDSNVIDVPVARLRGKLRELPDAPRIVTLRGVGFMLTAKAGDEQAG